MKKTDRTLYASPLEKGYWRASLAEFRSVRMLVVAALFIALRIAVKLVSIDLGNSLKLRHLMASSRFDRSFAGNGVQYLIPRGSCVPAFPVSQLFAYLLDRGFRIANVHIRRQSTQYKISAAVFFKLKAER